MVEVPSDRDLLPLTGAQLRIYSGHGSDLVHAGMTLDGALWLEGPIDADALEAAIALIIERHDGLRTRIVEIDGRPHQEFPRTRAFRLMRFSVDATAPGELDRVLRSLAGHRFALDAELLLRAALISMTATSHILCMAFHHIITDGWTLALFRHELAIAYRDLTHRSPVSLPMPSGQFSDFVRQETAAPRSEEIERNLRYWVRALEGSASLEQARANGVPRGRSLHGAKEWFELSEQESVRLKAFARAHGVTLYMVLLACFDILLYLEAGGPPDVIVGMNTANRAKAARQTAMGLFTNALPLRTRLDGNPTFRDVVERVRAVCLGGFAHENMAQGELVERVHGVPGIPLYRAYFTVLPAPVRRLSGTDQPWRRVDIDGGTGLWEPFLFVTDWGAKLTAFFGYRTQAFQRARILGMKETLLQLLRRLPVEPALSLQTIAREHPVTDIEPSAPAPLYVVAEPGAEAR